jgi:hypothetical protein
MAGLPAGTIAVEYTVATGPFFPTNASIASDTSTATTSTATTSGATVAASFPMNPSVGQLVFNTSAGKLYVWNGSAWVAAG